MSDAENEARWLKDRIRFDTAVNSSPFLTKEQRARAMNIRMQDTANG